MEENKEIEWEIPEEFEEDDEESEEEPEETEPELENIIETPKTFIRRRDAKQMTPFLEQEPIENLERDLQDVPTQTTETSPAEEEPVTYTTNTPQYTSDYETRYEIIQEARRPADPEMAGGALIRREEDMLGMGRPQERRIDFQRWQQANIERGGPEQQEKYIKEPKKIREEDKLPFQRKKRRGEF